MLRNVQCMLLTDITALQRMCDPDFSVHELLAELDTDADFVAGHVPVRSIRFFEAWETGLRNRGLGGGVGGTYM